MLMLTRLIIVWVEYDLGVHEEAGMIYVLHNSTFLTRLIFCQADLDKINHYVV
jgi:hypothetical protein